MKINDFFKTRSMSTQSKESFASKRLTLAFDKLRGTESETCSSTKLPQSSLSNKVKNQRKKRAVNRQLKSKDKKMKCMPLNFKKKNETPTEVVLSASSDSD